MISLFDLRMMNNDWDADMRFEIHCFEDWNNDKILYCGAYRYMPKGIKELNVRKFGTQPDGSIRIELVRNEEKKL